jgi:hypothetical protein
MPHPDQRIRHRSYTAFREWFESSGVDFWNECSADEELAFIASEIYNELKKEEKID